MLGDVVIHTGEIAGQWLTTVAVYVAHDQREGPEFKQVAAALDRDKNGSRVGAIQEWLRYEQKAQQ